MVTLRTFSDYWFNKFEDPALWLYAGFHHDEEVEQFRELFHAVVNHHTVPKTIKEHLLSLIVIDQLPRHLFRGQSKAYEFDELALTQAKEMYRAGWHTQLSADEFVFWAVVFEHAEDLEEHAFVRGPLLERIAQHAEGSEERRRLVNALVYLDKHSAVLQEFGRYPKRAEVRGAVTDAERIYLLGRVGKPY